MFVTSFLRRLPPEHVQFGLSLSLALTAGTLIGIILSVTINVSAHPPTLHHQSGSSVSTIVLEGFRDGALRGSVAGDMRLYVQDTAVPIDGSGAFAIDHPGFRIETVSVQVPAGMHFVASKRGKKYYGVTSAAGSNLAPENRVYFPTAEEAEAAGYKK